MIFQERNSYFSKIRTFDFLNNYLLKVDLHCVTVSVKWNVATGFDLYSPRLTTAGRDSLFVCGKEADSDYDTLTHYNLVTGEQRCTVKLDEKPDDITTVLYYNRRCIALSLLR